MSDRAPDAFRRTVTGPDRLAPLTVLTIELPGGRTADVVFTDVPAGPHAEEVAERFFRENGIDPGWVVAIRSERGFVAPGHDCGPVLRGFPRAALRPAAPDAPRTEAGEPARGPGLQRIAEILESDLHKVWSLDEAELLPDEASGWAPPGVMTPLLRYGMPVPARGGRQVRRDTDHDPDPWLDARPELHRLGRIWDRRLLVREGDGAVVALLPADDLARPEPRLLPVNSSPAAFLECVWRRHALTAPLREHGAWAETSTAAGEDVLHVHRALVEDVLRALDHHDPGVVAHPDSPWRDLLTSIR